jgi:hypothetical protein
MNVAMKVAAPAGRRRPETHPLHPALHPPLLPDPIAINTPR